MGPAGVGSNQERTTNRVGSSLGKDLTEPLCFLVRFLGKKARDPWRGSARYGRGGGAHRRKAGWGRVSGGEPKEATHRK